MTLVGIFYAQTTWLRKKEKIFWHLIYKNLGTDLEKGTAQKPNNPLYQTYPSSHRAVY
jgi:hypothetical protein